MKVTVNQVETAGTAVKNDNKEKEISIENEKELIEKQRRKIKKLAKAVLEMRAMKDANQQTASEMTSYHNQNQGRQQSDMGQSMNYSHRGDSLPNLHQAMYP